MYEAITEDILKIISQAVQAERERCKQIYVKYVDWAEWAISDEEAAEYFDEHYQEKYPKESDK